MAILEIRALTYIIGEKTCCLNEHTDFPELISEFEDLMIKISDRIKNQPDGSEFYFAWFLYSLVESGIWAGDYLTIENLTEGPFLNENLKSVKSLIEIFENSSKKFFLFTAYSLYSFLHIIVAAFINLHPEHERSLPWLQKVANKEIQGLMSSHTLIEVYSVITKLPLSPRISTDLAIKLIQENIINNFKLIFYNQEDYIKYSNLL